MQDASGFSQIVLPAVQLPDGTFVALQGTAAGYLKTSDADAQTALAAILAKQIAAPATAENQALALAMDLPVEVAISGTAGATLAAGIIGTATPAGARDWLTVAITDAAVTLTSFRVEYQFAAGGVWITRLLDGDFANGAKFDVGEFTDYVAATGHYANALIAGESVGLRLRITGIYAARFSAIGNGAAVAINGYMTKGA
jgi:hypothetical protein